MKRHLLLLSVLMLLISIKLQAQNTLVPNGDFEIWDNFGTITLPDNWPSSDLLWHYNGDTTTKTVTSSTRSHSGKFAVWIGPDTASGKIWPGFIATRFAYAQRPHHLSLYYIDSLDTVDHGSVIVSFFKYNSSTHNNDSVGGGVWNFPPGVTNAYANAEVPLYFVSSDPAKKPDTCTIKIIIASGATAKKPGHVLVDDVSLIVHDAGIDETLVSDKIDIFPNPTPGIINILSLNGIYPFYKIEVWDLNGQLLKSFTPIQGSNPQLDLSALADGVYLVKLTGDEGMVVRKVIVRK